MCYCMSLYVNLCAQSVPFRGHITGGMRPGKKVVVVGVVDPHPDRYRRVYLAFFFNPFIIINTLLVFYRCKKVQVVIMCSPKSSPPSQITWSQIKIPRAGILMSSWPSILCQAEIVLFLKEGFQRKKVPLRVISDTKGKVAGSYGKEISFVRFYIALTRGRGTSREPPPDVALELCVRFKDQQILRRACVSGSWGDADRAIPFFPFIKEQPFKVPDLLINWHWLELRLQTRQKTLKHWMVAVLLFLAFFQEMYVQG